MLLCFGQEYKLKHFEKISCQYESRSLNMSVHLGSTIPNPGINHMELIEGYTLRFMYKDSHNSFIYNRKLL